MAREEDQTKSSQDVEKESGLCRGLVGVWMPVLDPLGYVKQERQRVFCFKRESLMSDLRANLAELQEQALRKFDAQLAELQEQTFKMSTAFTQNEAFKAGVKVGRLECAKSMAAFVSDGKLAGMPRAGVLATMIDFLEKVEEKEK